MNKKKPLVSIIIPTHNSESHLEKCLKSIRNQTYKNIEIIVVDNNSIDCTKQIAEKYADKVIKQSGGMGVQINKGVEHSRGDFIAFFDDDMYLGPTVINECVEKAKNGYDAIIVPEKIIYNSFWAKLRDIEKSFYEGNINIEAARFIRRCIYLDAGGINEKLEGFRDFDIHQKIKEAGYVIGRISSSLKHDIDPDLFSILKKRFIRIQTFFVYLQEHPSHIKSIIFRKPLIVGIIKLFFKHPFLATSLVILKSGEYIASVLGIIILQVKRYAVNERGPRGWE